MQTILEKAEEILEKNGGEIPLKLLPTFAALPPALGAMAGATHSAFTAPPEMEHEEFQAELTKERLREILIEREMKRRKKSMQVVVDESKKSIRI